MAEDPRVRQVNRDGGPAGAIGVDLRTDTALEPWLRGLDVHRPEGLIGKNTREVALFGSLHLHALFTRPAAEPQGSCQRLGAEAQPACDGRPVKLDLVPRRDVELALRLGVDPVASRVQNRHPEPSGRLIRDREAPFRVSTVIEDDGRRPGVLGATNHLGPPGLTRSSREGAISKSSAIGRVKRRGSGRNVSARWTTRTSVIRAGARPGCRTSSA